MFSDFLAGGKALLARMFDQPAAPVPASQAEESFDRYFYHRAVKLRIEGYITLEVMRQFVMMGGASHKSPRIVVELDSEGCEESLIGPMRTCISRLCEGSDVRLVARGTCASASVFLMLAVPLNHRYCTPDVKLWIDAGSFPAQIRATLSKDQLEQADRFTPGVRKVYSVESALKNGTFSEVIDWL